jgi:uncharacterized protein (DUF1330 family)
MSAYVVLIMNKVNSLEWLAAYMENVPPLVQRHGGEYIAMSNGFKGEHIVCVDGAEPVPDAIGLLRFPSVTHVTDFFADPAYQPYRAMRVAATQGVAFAFEG